MDGTVRTAIAKDRSSTSNTCHGEPLHGSTQPSRPGAGRKTIAEIEACERTQEGVDGVVDQGRPEGTEGNKDGFFRR
jgi:hypothetical protein